MATYYFAWLGSKRIVKNHVYEKGAWLDTAMSRGLPVPNGGVLLDNFYLLCLQENVAIEASNMVIIPRAEAFYELLYQAVHFPHLDKPCAIRPLFERPVPARLPVNVSDPDALADSIAACWTAVLPAGTQTRRDILIQEMVAGEMAGTAVTQPETSVDLITVNENELDLPRLGRWGKTDHGQAAYLQRLQKLLNGVRRTFGDQPWQISWIDDGRVCWLIQLESNPSLNVKK